MDVVVVDVVGEEPSLVEEDVEPSLVEGLVDGLVEDDEPSLVTSLMKEVDDDT